MNHRVMSWSEERLLAELKEAMRAARPVPAAVDEFAREIFDLVDVPGSVAELVFDSRETEPAGVRTAQPSREMSFRAPGVEIEVTVLAEGLRHVVGQLIPPQRATVELMLRDERRTAEADRLGRFSFDDVPAGPLSLQCVLEDDAATVVQTEWMVI